MKFLEIIITNVKLSFKKNSSKREILSGARHNIQLFRVQYKKRKANEYPMSLRQLPAFAVFLNFYIIYKTFIQNIIKFLITVNKTTW